MSLPSALRLALEERARGTKTESLDSLTVEWLDPEPPEGPEDDQALLALLKLQLPDAFGTAVRAECVQNDEMLQVEDPPTRDALEGKGPQRRPQKRLGRRLEGVAKAVGGGYCRLQTPLKLALAVRETVAGHRLGALPGGGVPPGGGPITIPNLMNSEIGRIYRSGG